MLEGLKTFARQIRREHGLISEDDRREGAGGAAAPPNGEMEAEMAAAMEVDLDDGGGSNSGGSNSGGSRSSSSESGGEQEEEEGGKPGDKSAQKGQEETGHDGHSEALLQAAEKGEAAGLLGEYLRGSPQLNDLLRLWDLDERKVTVNSAVADVTMMGPQAARREDEEGTRSRDVRGTFRRGGRA